MAGATVTLQKADIQDQRYYRISIPLAFVQAKGWEAGDKLKIELDNKGRLVMEKLSNE